MMLYKWKLKKLVPYVEDRGPHPAKSKLGDLMFTKENDPLFPNRDYWSDEGRVEINTDTLHFQSSVTKQWWTQ